VIKEGKISPRILTQNSPKQIKNPANIVLSGTFFRYFWAYESSFVSRKRCSSTSRNWKTANQNCMCPGVCV